MRARAAPELFVGGFTQVWLGVPVLSLAGLDGARDQVRAVAFFLAASLASGARVARVECPDPARAPALIAAAEAAFAAALESIDGENATLMGYFDVYLKAAADVAEGEGDRIATGLAESIRG
jgi:hypothetical protein